MESGVALAVKSRRAIDWNDWSGFYEAPSRIYVNQNKIGPCTLLEVGVHFLYTGAAAGYDSVLKLGLPDVFLLTSLGAYLFSYEAL